MNQVISAPSPLQHDAGLRGPLMLSLVVLLLFGLLYSLLGAGLGRALFPVQAQGSMLERGGKVVGSALVAQPFVADRYFQPRPSAANYDPMAAAGSNQARSNPELHKRIAGTTRAVAKREGIAPAQVPGDLATQSGAGLDPHISPLGAQVQVARIARARGLDPAVVERLVIETIEPRQLGMLGQPRVNVLRLNLALDAMSR